MRVRPRDYRQLLVLLYYFAQGKRRVSVSSVRLSHILGISEARVFELFTMLSGDGYSDIVGMCEEVIKRKESVQEKVQSSSYMERCKVRYADVGRKFLFAEQDYLIYDVAMVYKRERERRTALPYMPFSMKRDPRRQPAWMSFKRTQSQLVEYGWDVDRYMIAQAEETAWCKAFTFLPVTWLGTDKSRERMFNWLEKTKLASIYVKKDSAYDQSKYLVENILRSRPDCKTVLDVLAIPGVIDQLSAEYLQDALKEQKVVAV